MTINWEVYVIFLLFNNISKLFSFFQNIAYIKFRTVINKTHRIVNDFFNLECTNLSLIVFPNFANCRTSQIVSQILRKHKTLKIVKSKYKGEASKKSKQQNNIGLKENQRKVIKISMMCVMRPPNICFRVLH